MRTDEGVLRSLMIEGLQGDSAAQTRLLRLITPLLRGFYRRRMRGVDNDVEDLVQETLIAIHTKRSTYDQSRSLTVWMFAIARYKLIDHFRRNRQTVTLDGVEDELIAEDFEDVAIARLDVEQLLSEISPKQARLIRATRIDGLSVAEAAERDGIGESDVKVSVHRGLKALMARVQGER